MCLLQHLWPCVGMHIARAQGVSTRVPCFFDICRITFDVQGPQPPVTTVGTDVHGTSWVLYRVNGLVIS